MIEPYALLALDAAIKGQEDKVPPFVDGSGRLNGDYRFPDGTVRRVCEEQLYRSDRKE